VILSESGLNTEVGNIIKTVRGKVEIDVWATDPATSPVSLYVCECTLWRTTVPQTAVHGAFRTVVADAGTHHALFIAAKGFQGGAYKVAAQTNVHLVTWYEFQVMFME